MIVKINEKFSKYIDLDAIRKFKLKNCKLITNSEASRNMFKEFLSRPKLVSLDFSKVVFKFEHLIFLAKGLEENQTIIHLRLEDFSIKQNLYENEKYTLARQRIDALLMLLESIQYKHYYEIISIYYPKNYIFGEFLKTDDKNVFYDGFYNLLLNNERLREFNFYNSSAIIGIICLSELLLHAIYKNEMLRIINGFDIKKFMVDNQKALKLANKYYGNYYKKTTRKFVSRKRNKNLKLEFYESMPIVLSDLV